ncbi:MAG: winged helix-turn-helix transcriptional regulator [Proteobacteria bacterium]|nr:winged helix-turn-helix transcriptional regulator [Pseudomonadota bacterium]
MKSTAIKATQNAAPPPNPTPGYAVEEQVGHLLRRAHQRHTAIFQESFAELQLTPTQFAALVKIKDLGQVSQNQLGRLTAMDPATIQGVIQRLLLRGLIGRHPDPGDRRCTLLRLMPSGLALAEKGVERGRAATEATLAPLAPAERAAFLALLRKLT